jgi:hypothetical protein
MPFPATVYNVMIASPGDVITDWSAIQEAIFEWNAYEGEQNHRLFVPLSWVTHSAPEIGGSAQGVINRQLVPKSDLLVALFWTRLGTPTEAERSGTAEEIMLHVQNKKPVLIYFRDPTVSLREVDLKQWEALEAFRAEMQKLGLTATYKDASELKKLFARHLTIKVRQDPYFTISSSSTTHVTEKKAPPDVSENARDLLVLVAPYGEFAKFRSRDGAAVIGTADGLHATNNPIDRAEVEAAIEELKRVGYIVAIGDKRDHLEGFAVTKAGFEYVDKIKGVSWTATQAEENAARRGLFSSLSQSLDEVISDQELKRFRMPPEQLFELGLRHTQYEKETDAEFLRYSAHALKSWEIPVDDRFRRQKLFRSLADLLSASSESQRKLFEAGLAAKIRDAAARMLIVKSVAENDLETLRAYGAIGMNFAVLNECPKFAAELQRRFGRKNAKA